MKKIFVTDYIGLCNRLEALRFSFGLQRGLGHGISVDWPEWDSVHVEGVQGERFRWHDRIGSIKLRDGFQGDLRRLGSYRRIVQRTWAGPPEWMVPIEEIGSRLRLRSDLRNAIAQLLAPHMGRPVVGVHIRRGDFQGFSDSNYDASVTRSRAVPLWWFEAVMHRLARRWPETVFLLSTTGDPQDLALLQTQFRTLVLPIRSPYAYKGSDHQSAVHPVADLFALACCRTLLATPGSTFGNFAANVLGPESVSILPPPRTGRANVQFGWVKLPKASPAEWGAVGKTGAGLSLDSGECLMVPEPGPPEVDWILTW